MKNISFIGLGHMGNPMVKNLLKAGFPVKVFDIMPQAVENLSSQGAHATSSIADCVKNADVVITMLQTGAQVKSTCLGPDGIFSHIDAKTLYLDCSSIEIAITQELHQEAKNKNIPMCDAPVSGGVPGAEAGTLTFMVGGSENNFEKAKPILEMMGKKIIHAGAEGRGQAAKICNNLILGISMIAVSEGFTLAEKLGLDPKKFFEISSNASGQCWSMTSYCPAPNVIEKSPSNNNYQPGFMAKMMLKDLHLAQQASQHVHGKIPLGDEATNLYTQMVDEGKGEMDFSGVIKLLK